jgi:hypothetical protein
LFEAGRFVEATVRKYAVIIKTKTQITTLACIAYLGKFISELCLCHAVHQFKVSNLYVALDEMVFDVQMPYASQFIGVTGEELPTSEVSVHAVRFRSLDVEETESKFDGLDAFDARGT